VGGAFDHFKRRYGTPRITRHLGGQGHHYDDKTVASSLRRQGLRAKAAKRFKATTDSNHNRPVAENVLGQDFTAERPNEKWAGDITYLWADQGWVYLAVILDLYSRQVIGWAMDKTMSRAGVRRPADGVVEAQDAPGSDRTYRPRQPVWFNGLPANATLPPPRVQYKWQRQLLR
jgi:transposase InsO family protein